MPDDQLLQVMTADRGKSEKSLSLKKYQLPFLESKLEFLGAFGVPFQAQVLLIRNRIQLVNQEAEEARFYFEKHLILQYRKKMPPSFAATWRQNIKS